MRTQAQGHADRLSRNNYRTTARIVGVLYLAGMVVGIGGKPTLIQSILGAPDHLSTIAASSMLLAMGAVLWLCTVAGDAAHGILMFPVLKPHSERRGSRLPQCQDYGRHVHCRHGSVDPCSDTDRCRVPERWIIRYL